jgi:hypothetical protein
MHFPSLLTLFCLSRFILAKDECQPVTWSKADVNKVRAATSLAAIATPSPASVIMNLSTAPGDINCRFWFDTNESVNYYTCTTIANIFEITTEEFFALNPELKHDCSNVMPLTTYCVDGCK